MRLKHCTIYLHSFCTTKKVVPHRTAFVKWLDRVIFFFSYPLVSLMSTGSKLERPITLAT